MAEPTQAAQTAQDKADELVSWAAGVAQGEDFYRYGIPPSVRPKIVANIAAALTAAEQDATAALRAQLAEAQERGDNWRKAFEIKQDEFHAALQSRKRLVTLLRAIDEVLPVGFRWYSNLVDRAQLLDDQYKHAKSVAQHALAAAADAGEGR